MSASANIFNFDSNEVMRRLAANDWVGSWEYLRQLLQSFTITADINTNITLQTQIQDETRRKYVADFGAMAGELILALLSDPQSKLSEKSFMSLIFYHETLHTLLYLHGMDNTDALVQGMLNAQRDIPENQQRKILLLLSMNTELDIVAILRRMDTKYRMAMTTALLATSKLFRPNIYKNKVKIYALRHDVDKAGNDDQTLMAAIQAYFNCSYLNEPHKHTLKENINKAVKNFLQSRERDFRRIKNDLPQLRLNIDANKPILLVPLEEFSRGHAMNRGWGKWIESLQSEFNVILMLLADKADPVLHESFSNIVTYADLGDFMALMYAVKPDVIFLPSVGMLFYGIVAANMRNAPLQIMGLGHPATSMCREIDFVYGPEHLYHPDAFPQDRYIADNLPYTFLPSMKKDVILRQDIYTRQKGDTGPLKVAVVGSYLKISYPFIELLKEIEAESDFPIHFSFHLATFGMDSLYAQTILSKYFPSMTFTGQQSYADYFQSLKNIDIVLNPFPFGHTNTIIDALLLGKPCVGMHGVEPAARTEKYILDIVGLADMFSAEDRDDYKQKFQTLARRVLQGDTHFYDRARVYDLLYAPSTPTDFGKLIKWAYDNQKKMTASGKKLFMAFDE